MSTTAITPSPSTTTTILNELRRLSPESLNEIRQKLEPEQRIRVPHTSAGGIQESLTFDDILERANEMAQEEYKSRPNAQHFSKIGTCFRKEWYATKKAMPDDGVLDTNSPESKYRFDPGNSEPGHATENHVQLLMEKVYTKGRPGAILKDLRMSLGIDIETEDAQGKGVKETVYLSGKSDVVLLGDNMEVLEFMEIKSPIFWPKKKTYFIEKFGKVVPLAIAKIEDPLAAPDGLVNINQALQLAVGVHILRQSGRPPKRVTLFYINRERYREHLAIRFTPEEVAYLHDFAVWWVQEHQINLKSETPPASTFLMGWECGRCPWVNRCVAQDKKAGTPAKTLHPIVRGINDRLMDANKASQPL